MRYSAIKPNDVANGDGVCVSLFVQGCHHHCKNCFNQSTWDFNGGKEFTSKELEYIKECINKNGVMRNFSVLGGSPFAPENIDTVLYICDEVKKSFPDIKIYVWTGYLYEDLISKYGKDIFKNIDILIDGKFEEDKKDLSLKLRGSSNQRIIDLKNVNI
ncbi:anaerobic ribonucleoside-triphosphate reductase activating protein [Terrisporobacter mayombei]|nr:anaerobic ribonucleoside-triphosphate reductase activating protein [Terrisporobacter mayombei]